jgi:hypothetical protein
MNKLNDLYDSIKLSEQLAEENYQQRNGVVDFNVPGECNHYFAKYDQNGQRVGEICLYCKLSKTVKGSLRYTYKIDGKRIAKREIDHKFISLGAFLN